MFLIVLFHIRKLLLPIFVQTILYLFSKFSFWLKNPNVSLWQTQYSFNFILEKVWLKVCLAPVKKLSMIELILLQNCESCEFISTMQNCKSFLSFEIAFWSFLLLLFYFYFIKNLPLFSRNSSENSSQRGKNVLRRRRKTLSRQKLDNNKDPFEVDGGGYYSRTTNFPQSKLMKLASFFVLAESSAVAAKV